MWAASQLAVSTAQPGCRPRQCFWRVLGLVGLESGPQEHEIKGEVSITSCECREMPVLDFGVKEPSEKP